jgi:hypothetical protein
MPSSNGKRTKRGRDEGISLHPLTLEEALRGAMATGAPPPGPTKKPKPGKEEEKRAPRKRGRKPGPAKQN